MTQEKIVSEVKSRLGQTQVSDKTIATIVALTPLADGVEPDDAYFDKIKVTCESIQGNINSVASQSVKVAKAEWEKPAPQPDKKQEQKDDKSPEGDAITALQEQIKALEESIKGVSAKTTIDATRQQVLDKAISLKVSKINLWNDVVSGLEVNTESKADDLVTLAKATYEKKLKSYFGDGATPYGKTENGVELDQKDAYDSFFNQMKAEGKMGQEKTNV